MARHGYNDPALVRDNGEWDSKRWGALIISIALICGVWFFLNQKLLFGGDWISPTYDNPDWYANEGGLRTHGAWDLETHVWKTEYIIENFPNYGWNPNWYLGMPLLKYYPSGFYVLHAPLVMLSGLSAAKSSTILIISGHLLATILTFALCYKVSRKMFTSALCSIFLLASSFISLRSYGWEPVSAAFMFLFPLGLLLFFKDPLNPLRFSMILMMAVTYLAHPLIFFSLCMTMGIYLMVIAIREDKISPFVKHRHYIWAYFGLVGISLLIGAVQFFPQVSYDQVTSGAHLGVSYLPFYQVQYNILPVNEFLFDIGNLKGAGGILLVALLLTFVTGFRGKKKEKMNEKGMGSHSLIAGLGAVILAVIAFYYLEKYGIFPMNLLRSIQYHRIMPELIVLSAVFVAALSNVIRTKNQKIIYYSVLVIFVIASMSTIYSVQARWVTTDNISDRPEFIYDEFEGRISFPYPHQSLSVRNSFTQVPQTYGYYEQGITNSYSDEIFSVSSGFHERNVSLTYLKAANVARLYVNTEEGERDIIVRELFKDLPYHHNEVDRYAYFEIPLVNAGMAQAVDVNDARKVQTLSPGCRILFEEEYCGSVKEEFVTSDPEEVRHLESYVALTEEEYFAKSEFIMENPDRYLIDVGGATENTAVIVKMTYDESFTATIDGEEIEIEKIGPDFMLIAPGKDGTYTIELEYGTPRVTMYGAIVSVVSLLVVSIYFAFRPRKRDEQIKYPRGDM